VISKSKNDLGKRDKSYGVFEYKQKGFEKVEEAKRRKKPKK